MHTWKFKLKHEIGIENEWCDVIFDLLGLISCGAMGHDLISFFGKVQSEINRLLSDLNFWFCSWFECYIFNFSHDQIGANWHLKCYSYQGHPSEESFIDTDRYLCKFLINWQKNLEVLKGFVLIKNLPTYSWSQNFFLTL